MTKIFLSEYIGVFSGPTEGYHISTNHLVPILRPSRIFQWYIGWFQNNFTLYVLTFLWDSEHSFGTSRYLCQICLIYMPDIFICQIYIYISKCIFLIFAEHNKERRRSEPISHQRNELPVRKYTAQSYDPISHQRNEFPVREFTAQSYDSSTVSRWRNCQEKKSQSSRWDR